jgi:hypothetical protein
MAAEGALIDFFRKILQSFGVHLIPRKEEFPEPGFTDGPVLGGLKGIKRRNPLIMGHCEDRALLDAFAATSAAVNLDHLFEREFQIFHFSLVTELINRTIGLTRM